MPTRMVIDGVQAALEYDPDEDRFYGTATVSGGYVSFNGRDPDELRAGFRAALAAQQEALAEAS